MSTKMERFHKLIARQAEEIEELKQQLASSNRAGWEQCQRGVYQYLKHEEKSATLHQQMAYIKYVADAIAAMEYKEGDHEM